MTSASKFLQFARCASVMALAALPLGAAAQDAPEPVTLTIANSQWLDALRGENLWNALLKYQEVAPHVTLEQRPIPSSEFAARITTELATGQGPDLAIMLEPVFYALADAGLLADLTPVVDGHDDLNITNESGMIDGHQYGIAWQRAVYGLIYNKALLDKAGASVPTTVDELITSASMVKEATGAQGFAARHQMNEFEVWSLDFQNWAFGNGVHYVDDAGNLTIDTPELAAAFRDFKKVYDADVIPRGDDMSTQRNRFKSEQMGFSIDNTGGSLNIASGGAMPSTDLYTAPLPFEHVGAHNQLFITVSDSSENREAAFDFLDWLIGPDGQVALRAVSGPDALATDVPMLPEFAAQHPWAEEMVELAKTSRSPLIPGYETRTNSIMRFVMTALEEVLVADADPETVLAQAQERIDREF
ncbi:ABC transporter substrate-binding protein [Salipiger abyssi]|uniref:ABC transporter substrate-binding protein n=1 Tax=Salipiger abyssi TaxID=1250539 RepID=UPI001A8C8B8E|nr:extracellular solute-binding protein [Salipiger abyssi]MBN9888955.1 extracellular solute-binding protein [Salipiger abyssi]